MVSESNKRIIKNSALLYIRVIFCQLLGIYTARKILEVLGVEDYGIMNVVMGVTTILTFLNGSMSVATQRYLTIELGKSDLSSYNKTFVMSCMIHLLLAVLLFFAAESIGLWFLNTYLNVPTGRMIAANWVYQASVFIFMFGMVQAPYAASVNAHEDMHVFAYLEIGYAVARLAIVLMLSFCSFDRLIVYGLLLLCVEISKFAIYHFYCLKKYDECRFVFQWDKRLFRSFLGFTGWNMFGTVAWILKDQGNNIMMNMFGGVTVNAAMGVAVQVSKAVMNVFGGFQTAVNPQITKNYAANDFTGLHKLVIGSSKISFFLILLVALPVFMETPYILDIWLVSTPEYSVTFIRICLVEAVFQTLFGPVVTALMATGNIKWYQIVVGCIMMLIVPVSYIFLRMGFSVVTPLVVSLVIVVISILVRAVFCKIQIRLPLSEYIFKVIIPCVSVLLFSLLLPFILASTMDDGFVRLVVMSVLCGMSVIACSYFIGLNRNERRLVTDLVRVGIKHFHK